MKEILLPSWQCNTITIITSNTQSSKLTICNWRKLEREWVESNEDHKLVVVLVFRCQKRLFLHTHPCVRREVKQKCVLSPPQPPLLNRQLVVKNKKFTSPDFIKTSVILILKVTAYTLANIKSMTKAHSPDGIGIKCIVSERPTMVPRSVSPA